MSKDLLKQIWLDMLSPIMVQILVTLAEDTRNHKLADTANRIYMSYTLTNKHAHSKWLSQKRRYPSAREWTSQNEITDAVSNPAYLKTESNNTTAITTHT